MIADGAGMNGDAATQSKRLCAGLLFMICVLALVPATALAYFGLRWLPGLEGRNYLSAAALLSGPFPLVLGAFFALRAARGRNGRNLLAAACFTLLAVPVYAVAWAWGGRLLL